MIHGLSLSVGIRSADDRRVHDAFVPSVNTYCIGPAAGCLTGPATRTIQSSHSVTWTAGVSEQLTDRTLVYLTSSKGYRPGGQNGINATTGVFNPGYGPESVLEHELGVKSDWTLFGMPLRTNADLWYQNYSNIQLLVLHPYPGGPFIDNTGAAHLYGAEFEMLADLTPSLQWGLNYGYGRIRFVNFLPGTDAGSIANLQTTRTQNFPPHKLSSFLQYRLPLAADVGRSPCARPGTGRRRVAIQRPPTASGYSRPSVSST